MLLLFGCEIGEFLRSVGTGIILHNAFGSGYLMFFVVVWYTSTITNHV